MREEETLSRLQSAPSKERFDKFVVTNAFTLKADKSDHFKKNVIKNNSSFLRVQ
jgi:hypothetical protein